MKRHIYLNNIVPIYIPVNNYNVSGRYTLETKPKLNTQQSSVLLD